MIQHHDIEINSFTEFVAWVDDHVTSGMIFRGQKLASWGLVPSIQRKGVVNVEWPNERLACERKMLGQFKRHARPYLTEAPSDDWEWLALAQHHGLPTRLLDWTEHAAAALYFAIQLPNNYQPSAVWCADKLYNVALSKYLPFNIDSIVLYEPPHIEPRITVQRACFTAHPTDYIGKEYVWPGPLFKLTIPASARVNIRGTLRSMGIHRATLFPDLDGIAEEIERRNSVVLDEPTTPTSEL